VQGSSEVFDGIPVGRKLCLLRLSRPPQSRRDSALRACRAPCSSRRWHARSGTRDEQRRRVGVANEGGMGEVGACERSAAAAAAGQDRGKKERSSWLRAGGELGDRYDTLW
jgi:hypothetical protein